MIRVFGHYISRIFIGLGLVEFVVLWLSFLAGYYIRVQASFEQLSAPHAAVSSLGACYGLITVLAMIAVGLYQRGLPWGAGLLLRLSVALAASIAISLLLFLLILGDVLGRGTIGLTVLFSIVGVLSVRSLFLRFAGGSAFLHKVLVLGVGRNAEIIRGLEESEPLFKVVGYLKAGEGEERIPGGKELAAGGIIADLMFAQDADELVVAVDDRRKRLPLDQMLDCKMRGLRIYDLVSFLERETYLVSLATLQPSWLIFSSGFQRGPFSLLGKRIMDLVGAGLLVLITLPLMILVSFAILIDSKGRGPVFFHQTRVGIDGKSFRLHKFRSMRVDAEAGGVARWATEGDPRVTPLGRFIRKTRLDELPQLLNVLRGEMSLVGPRPERPEFVSQLSSQLRFYSERHRVKPGLTGWAQLNYPYGSSIDDAKRKLEYDLYYAKNASLFLDLLILLQTVEIVLWGKGAR